jgi:hypothetical protein
MACHHIFALAMRDQRLIRGLFETEGGLKSHLDAVLDGCARPGIDKDDHRNFGALWIWCLGCERLGLNELGFGYTTPGGKTVRDYFESIYSLCDPRIEIPGGRPFYGRSALINSRRPFTTDAIPHVFYGGLVPLGLPGNNENTWPFWVGKPNKKYDPFYMGEAEMGWPLIFELAHRRWPERHFDYFLAQMRAPGDDKYQPSPYFGLAPVDPATVTPPAIASLCLPSCGVAMLRAEEGPGYWTSPAPSLLVRMGRSGPGSFGLQSFHAFNRPIYLGGRALNERDYGKPWTGSARSYCTVTVDNMMMGKAVDAHNQFVTRAIWPRQPGELPVRQSLDSLVKFVAFRAKPQGIGTNEVAMYPGVDMERALFLTREYLFDTFAVQADKPHTYHWLVHALGEARPERPADWKLSSSLDESLGSVSRDLFNFTGQQRLADSDGAWSLTVEQGCGLDDASRSRLGAAWYDRRIGVRVTMLGEKNTAAYFARTPLQPVGVARDDAARIAKQRADSLEREQRERYDAEDRGSVEPPPTKQPDTTPAPAQTKAKSVELAPDEVGSVSIIAERKAENTMFVAVHEPFEQGQWKIRQVRRIQQTPHAVAVAIAGDSVNDRILLAMGDEAGQPSTLAGDGESFTFAGQAFVRIGPDQVQVVGDLRAMQLKVNGQPGLVVNGQKQSVKVANGVMRFNP